MLSAKLKKEIWPLFQGYPLVYLATSQGGQPRVRPVTLIFYRQRFWVMTGAKDQKIWQIRKNSAVEFCLAIKRGKNTGYLRAQGQAQVMDDRKTRIALARHTPFFDHYWKDPNDPGYALICIEVKAIEYLRPGELLADKVALL